MRKLSADEFAQLPIKGHGRSSEIFNSLINLKAGEGLLIERKDWNRKAAPSSLIRYIEKKHNIKFQFGTLADNKGWAVQRIDKSKKGTAQDIADQKANDQKETNQNTDPHKNLRAEVTLFYLGRITINKIERIEDSLKAVYLQFWQEDKKVLEKLFKEVIDGLSTQRYIVMENEKTYLPLKK